MILWGGWYGSRNIGDQLLLLTICELLDDTLDKVEYVVLTDDPDHVTAYASRESTSVVTGLATRKQLLKTVREIFTADILFLVALFLSSSKQGIFWQWDFLSRSVSWEGRLT